MDGVLTVVVPSVPDDADDDQQQKQSAVRTIPVMDGPVSTDDVPSVQGLSLSDDDNADTQMVETKDDVKVAREESSADGDRLMVETVVAHEAEKDEWEHVKEDA